MNTSEAKSVCVTMSGYKLMFIRKRQSHQSRNVGSRFRQSFGGLSA